MMTWLRRLTTQIHQESCALVVKLTRMAIKLTQPDADACKRMRPDYAQDGNALIAVGQVVATHFGAIALAGDYWKDAQ